MTLKYKLFNKSTTLLEVFPHQRLLHFKRSKWSGLQKKLLKVKPRNNNKIKIKPSTSVYFNSLIKIKFGAWDKQSTVYRQLLDSKNLISLYSNSSISLSKFKKLLLKSNSQTTKLLVSTFLKIEVFLWRLGLFKSTLEVLQALKTGLIYVNGRVLQQSIILKKGDLIKIKEKPLSLHLQFIKELFPFYFCEIDYYTNTIVLLKDATDFSQNDLPFLFNTQNNLNLFSEYLTKK